MCQQRGLNFQVDDEIDGITIDTRKGGFKTDLKIIKECGELPAILPTIFFSQFANAKKDALMEEYPNQEWLAYLQGEKVGIDWKIYDIVVPLQIATAGSVETDPDNSRPKNCVGTIHSHGKSDFKTDFSITDVDYLIENYYVSIVTTGYNMTGNVKIMVPCGSFMVVESHVIVEQPVFELRKWLTNAKKLICKPPKQEFVYEYDSQEKLVECSECHKMKPFAVMYVENKKMLCHTCANL